MENGEFKNKVDQLTGVITALSNSQKLLTQVALDYQALAFAKKHQIKEAIKNADDLGDILKVFIAKLNQITDRCVNQFFDDEI